MAKTFLPYPPPPKKNPKKNQQKKTQKTGTPSELYCKKCMDMAKTFPPYPSFPPPHFFGPSLMTAKQRGPSWTWLADQNIKPVKP
jgi:hypothetical protein